MRTGIGAICATLGLGVPCGPPEPVSGGSSASGWRVPTARGRWLVKTTTAPAGWQRHEMRVSGRLERAAYEAGIPMPAPAQPTGTEPTGIRGAETAGYWVRLGPVTDGTALVREAATGDPAFRLVHRDVSRANIVVAAGGPVLIDFDYAGPEVPWWEFVHHCFDLASPALGASSRAGADSRGPGGLRRGRRGGRPGPARPGRRLSPGWSARC